MTFKVENTKEDVLKIYKECLNSLQKNYPNYYDVVSGYKFGFGRKKTSYGTCYYRKKEIKIHMYLSKVVKKEKVKDTILHEMAHAIDKGVNGFSSGHGAKWKSICREIGCKPSSSSSAASGIVKPSKYVMVIDNGGGYEYVSPVHRLSKKKPLNTFLPFTYLRGRKEETKGKLKVVTFKSFEDNRTIDSK
jgi:predicted SprT family Zn-dependent metalloprotease